MDGYIPWQMLSAKRKTGTEWLLKLLQYHCSFDLIVQIQMIDPKTKLTVWNYPEDRDQTGLYVPAENARYYDLIVNVGRRDKPDEFQFDKIDYQALLHPKYR